MKVSLVIPAKGESERIHNKNMYKIGNKSLTYLACEKALLCKNVHNVYLDTDSDEIIFDTKPLQHKGLKIIKRPKELANNQISANDLMIWALHSIEECDLICQTFVTSPLITSRTIDECIERFIEKNDNNDSFFTVIPVQEYFWSADGKAKNFSTKVLPNSFELEKQYMETHGLYGIYSHALLKLKTRVGKSPMLINIPKNEAFDINEPDDIEILKRMDL